MLGVIPLAEKLGLFVLALVLAAASVSYVAALRASRRRGTRTKLMPDSVDRAITPLAQPGVRPGAARFKKPAEAAQLTPGAHVRAVPVAAVAPRATCPSRWSRRGPCRRGRRAS